MTRNSNNKIVGCWTIFFPTHLLVRFEELYFCFIFRKKKDISKICQILFKVTKPFFKECVVSWQVGKHSKILHINFHIGLFEQVHSASKLTIIKAYDFFYLYVEIVLGRPKNMANIHIFGLAILVKECSKGFDIYVTFFVACIVYPKL